MSDRPSDEAKAARQSLDELPLLPARCSGAMAKDHGDANTFIGLCTSRSFTEIWGIEATSPIGIVAMVHKKSKAPLRRLLALFLRGPPVARDVCWRW